jgi:hypothetical protein
VTSDRLGRVRRVAGVDASYERQSGRVCAAIAVLALPELAPVEHVVVRRKARFPYLPGYLSFREAPAVLAALEKLRSVPDLLLCDGQGYAHPRRFGLACHLGLLADLPSNGDRPRDHLHPELSPAGTDPPSPPARLGLEVTAPPAGDRRRDRRPVPPKRSPVGSEMNR